MKSVKEEIKQAEMPIKEMAIQEEMAEAQIQEVCDLAGIKTSQEQTHMEGFEGQPEKPIFRGRGSAWSMNTPFVKDPEAVKAAMANATRWRSLGLKHRAKTNREILDRIDYYFEQCMMDGVRPTIETMSLALGYSRITTWNWKNGIKCDSERQQIIIAAYDTVAAFDADMVTNGSMNPVVYIFRSKNFYDMRDQTELVVQQNNPLGEIVSVEEIEEKYAELPPD